MGGGVSLIEGVEELMTTTILIGRAISSMTFPGMYRIYDFHSKKAPKLKNAKNFTFFSNESDDEDDDEDSPQPDPSTFSHFFKVVVNGDSIYLEDPLEENEAGWTPLHACCMSLSTVSAGLALVDETVRRGGSLEGKTKNGPGTFNRGWTALHMACAYGIDPLVEKLVESGADVNATNCYGFSCLHEACHRGYADIVRSLLKNKDLDLAYMPPDEATFMSPFASAPPQSALGEAARCGFFRIVQVLLDAGAPKDQRNRLGWTPLHEACFYHRIETVKTLLLAGANASARTNKNALPYQLAGLQEIRTMLVDMGGPSAVPSEGDVIDMVDILTELTLQSEGNNPESQRGAPTGTVMMTTGSHVMPVLVLAPMSHDSAAHSNAPARASASAHSPAPAITHARSRDEDSKGSPGHKAEEEKLLHSGPALGNLPSLSSPPKHASPLRSDIDSALGLDSKSLGGPAFMSPLSRKADDKTKKNRKKRSGEGGREDAVPSDMPREFLCQLTQRPMSDPVKTVYGNIYDRTAITQWIASQGRICPLTGAPLTENDLTPVESLANEIRQWILKRSLAKSVEPVAEAASTPVRSDRPVETVDEDLYDF